MAFFAAYPEVKTKLFCMGMCYEVTDHIEGVTIDDNGIWHVTKCMMCGTNAKELSKNALETVEENHKLLARLCNHFGLNGY